MGGRSRLRDRRQAKLVTPEVVGEVDIKGKQGEWLYEPQTNPEQLARAREMIGDETQTGEAALRRRLRDDHQWTGDDTALAVEVIRRAFAAGDDVLGVELSKALAPKLRTAGQAVQAASIIKRLSPEGQLLRAERAASKARDDMGLSAVRREDELTESVDKLMKAETVKAAEKVTTEIDSVTERDFTADAKEPPTPAETLFQLIYDYLAKPKEAKNVDPEQAMIKQMVQELFKIAKQTLPKRAWVGKSPYTVVGEIVKNRANYPEVWDEAKAKVLDAYAGDADVKARLDAYTAQNPVPVVSDQRLNTVIRTAFKDKGVKLGELVRSYYQGGREQAISLKDYIIEQAGLSGPDADYLAKYVTKRIAEQGRDAKVKALTGLLRAKGVRVPPTLLDSVRVLNQLASLGAFRKPAFIEAVMARLSPELRAAMKRAKVDMEQIVRDGVKATELEQIRFVKELSEHINMPIAESRTVFDAALSEFNKVAEEKRLQILNRMTPRERTETVRKSAIDKIIDLYHLTGFSDPTMHDYVRQILGLPSVTPDMARTINNLMTGREALQAATTVTDYKTELAKAFSEGGFTDKQQAAVMDIFNKRVERAEDPATALMALRLYLDKAILSKVREQISNLTPVTTAIRLKGLQRVSMLFNPTSILVRNPLGNVIYQQGIANVSETAAFGMDKLFSLARKSPQTVNLPSLRVQWRGLFEGARDTVNDIRLGVQTSPNSLQYELPLRRVFTSNFWNALDQIVSRGLTLGDRPFYQAAYNDALQSYMKLNNETTPSKEAIDYANRVGLIKTYQDTNAIRKAFIALRDDVLNVASMGKGPDSFGAGNLAIPFAGTPANLFARALDHSIVGLWRTVRAIRTDGKFDQQAFVKNAANLLTGAGLFWLGYSLTANGFMRGGRKRNKREEEALQETGRTPYSFIVGGRSHTYDWAQPASMLIAMGADVAEMKKSETDAIGIIKQAIISGGDSLFNLSLMQGLRGMTGYNSMTEGYLETLADAPLQVIPALSGKFARSIDPTIRSTYSPNETNAYYRRIIAKIPGLSFTLEPRINAAGKETKYEGGIGGQFFSPAISRKISTSTVDKELLRVYTTTGQTDIFPARAPMKVTFEGKPYPLTPEQLTAYARALGTTTYVNLQAAMSVPGYWEKSEEDKADALTKAVDQASRDTRKAMLETITGIPQAPAVQEREQRRSLEPEIRSLTPRERTL
jgi:hypothetical protein